MENVVNNAEKQMDYAKKNAEIFKIYNINRRNKQMRIQLKNERLQRIEEYRDEQAAALKE